MYVTMFPPPISALAGGTIKRLDSAQEKIFRDKMRRYGLRPVFLFPLFPSFEQQPRLSLTFVFLPIVLVSRREMDAARRAAEMKPTVAWRPPAPWPGLEQVTRGQGRACHQKEEEEEERQLCPMYVLYIWPLCLCSLASTLFVSG